MYKPTIKYYFCKLYLSITRFIISLTKFREVHLGTRVIYKHRHYCVSNCNSYLNGEQIFKLSNEYFQFPIYAKRSEFRKEHDLDNLIHDVTAWWKWYEKNWLEMDARSMERFDQLSSIRCLGKAKARGTTKRYRFK